MELSEQLQERLYGVISTNNFQRYNILFYKEEGTNKMLREDIDFIKDRAGLGKLCMMCTRKSCVAFAQCIHRNHYFAEQNQHPHNMVIPNATYLFVRTEFEEELLKEFELAEEYDIDLECKEATNEQQEEQQEETTNEQQEEQQEENTDSRDHEALLILLLMTVLLKIISQKFECSSSFLSSMYISQIGPLWISVISCSVYM